MPVYFITGTNRANGIGFQLVSQLVADPSNTVLASSRSPHTSEPLTSLASTHPNLRLMTLDVTSKESISGLSAQLEEHAPTGIDVFINNAAVGASFHPVLESEFDEMITHLTVNVVGAIMVFKEVYPFLLKRETRKSFFISAIGGSLELGFPCMGVYGASKAALNRILVSLASEVRDQGVVVGIVHPGIVETDMFYEVDPANKFPEEIGRATMEMLVSPDTCANNILEMVGRATLENSGKFVDAYRDGVVILW